MKYFYKKNSNDLDKFELIMTFSAQLRSILQKMVSCNMSLDYELIMTFSAQLSSILHKKNGFLQSVSEF
jgi:hypothetical protein